MRKLIMTTEAQACILRANHGVITRGQARGSGLTSRQIDRRVKSGEWVRVYPSIYRHGAIAPTWYSEMLAACHSAGGIASHRSAAYLHGFDGFKPTRRELVVAHGQRRQHRGVIVHQSTQMGSFDVVNRIPCTGILRTVIDLGAVVSKGVVCDVVDEVLRTRGATLTDLNKVLRRDGARGRSGTAALRAALAGRGDESPVPLSSWSRMFSDLLTSAGLTSPVCEHRIVDDAGQLVAQVDLAYPEHNVAIELDSIRWHMNRTSFTTDRQRWNRLMLAGWSVLVFTWPDYQTRAPQVIDEVRCALAAAKSAT
ncbi:type IV toxin-antitoxin system AbiEi family antitoxin domain-containing protein [Acidimicrobiaceae bacterium AH-315-P05]|nr:type IV toxin-antitoxin system AbiEi family antitoxin domain-containing protein [Acidimicrobiaceae bacterium AH-315-P05]